MVRAWHACRHSDVTHCDCDCLLPSAHLRLVGLIGEADCEGHPGRRVGGVQGEALPQGGDGLGVLLVLSLGGAWPEEGDISKVQQYK